jgi:tRNA(adenine34) deaminase
MSEEKWMKAALALGKEAGAADEVPIGAILVSTTGEILGRGRNRREELHRTTAHAEIMALEDFNARFSTWRLPPETKLYVTVEPCLMCTGALLWARLHTVVYGCRDTREAGLERIRTLIEEGVYDHKFSGIVEKILENECSNLISAYFQSKRKKSQHHLTPDFKTK